WRADQTRSSFRRERADKGRRGIGFRLDDRQLDRGHLVRRSVAQMPTQRRRDKELRGDNKHDGRVQRAGGGYRGEGKASEEAFFFHRGVIADRRPAAGDATKRRSGSRLPS